MNTISRDDFLKCLKASKVIAPEKLKKILAALDNQSPKEIATFLIRKNLLTKWQAKNLLTGRYKLKLANYRLIDRLRRDEFGDRYLAIHEQLDRKVEIQLFPKELNQTDEKQRKFLASASEAAKVDHPNVVHVYDIDLERDRLYLVVEHTKGELLSSFDADAFSEIDAARIVKQSLDGLKAAHERGIVHGQIEEKNLIVTPDNQVKILNLMMASLFNENYAKKTPESDIRTVGKLGTRILKAIDATDESAKTSLAKIFSSLEKTNSAETDFTSLLEAWVSQNEDLSAQTVISARPVVQAPRKSASKKVAAKESVKESQDDEPASEDPVASPTFLQRQNPLVVISTAAVASLLTLCGVAWLAYAVTSPPATAKNTPRSVKIKPRTNKTGHSVKAKSEALRKERTPAGKHVARKISPEDLAAAQAQLEQKFGSDEPAAAPSIATDENPPVVDSHENPNPTENPVVSSPSESNSLIAFPDKHEPIASEDEIQNLAVGDSDAAPEAAESIVGDTPEKAETPKVKEKSDKRKELELEKPFMDLPRQVDLGEIENSSPQQLGNIYVPSNILMAVELIHSKAIAKSKFVFELERSTVDKQRWLISFKKRKASQPVKIGEFFRENETFNFQWESGAAENDNHNYLRNCALKLSGQNGTSAFAYLRPSIKLDNFVVTAEQPSNKIETDIRWLPNPENLRIEVLPLPYTGVPKNYLYPPSRQIEGRNGVQIFFDENAEDRYLYIQVGADTKKNLKLFAALLFNPRNGKKSSPVTPQWITDASDRVAKNSDELSAKNNIWKDSLQKDRPTNMTKDQFEEAKDNLKKQAKSALALKKQMVTYEEFVPLLYDKPIPIRVYFEMENMQIELASSMVEDK